MWCVLVFVALGSHGPASGPVYAGVAARAPDLQARADEVAVALGQALEQAGFADLGSPAPSNDAAGRDPEIQAHVARARVLYLEGNFAAARDELERALERFDADAAFSAGPSWEDLADALVLRFLALDRLGRDEDAKAALVALATLKPDGILDPEIAPPKAQARFDAARAELKRAPRVQIEVRSEPPGAEVTVDGRVVGRAPLTVEDLLPGAHYVGLALHGERVGRRVQVSVGTARVDERIADERTVQAHELRALLEAPIEPSALTGATSVVGTDVVVGVVVGVVTSAGAQAALVVTRAHDGQLHTLGAPLPDVREAGALREVVLALTDGLRAGRAGWIDRAPTGVRGAPEALLAQPGTQMGAQTGTQTDAQIDVDQGAQGTWLWASLAVGIGVVAAGVTVALLALQPPTLEVTIDASRL